MSKPVTVTDDTFQDEVIKSDIPVLVDFWAAWCGPCKMIAPTLDKIAEEYDGRAKICKVDVDNNVKLSQQYGIRSIPTLLFFSNGEKMDQAMGAVQKSELTKKLDNLM